jgi:hypothetical protein
MWGKMDSNHRTRKRTDLQSVVVGHLTIPPFNGLPDQFSEVKNHLLSLNSGAKGGIRTPDLLITNQ